MSADRLLVPVSDSPTLRQTVEYAVRTALEGDETPTVRFVYVHATEQSGDPPDQTEPDAAESSGEDLLDRVAVWAREDASDHQIHVETAHLGREDYLFSPEDVATILATDARDHDVGRIVLDPEYDPGIGAPFVRPLEYELTRYPDFRTEEAPVRPQTRRTPLLERTSPRQVLALAGVCFGFYVVLAGIPTPFDVVTGVATATIVAIALSQVTLSRNPTRLSLLRLGRSVLYVPYLLWEILKANVAVAAVILHPRLPIDPRLTRVRPALWGSLPITTLANSITLTPGTLTVRVDGRTLTVHTLVPGAREDLFDGGLERAVRFVFYGRRAMTIASLRDRGETRILQGPDGDRPGPDVAPTERRLGTVTGESATDAGATSEQGEPADTAERANDGESDANDSPDDGSQSAGDLTGGDPQ